MTDLLRHTVKEDGMEFNKLQIIDGTFSFTEPYNLIGALFACAIFKFAQYSTDQEFVQRQLTCKSVKKAATSLIYSQVLSLPVVIIFMIIGLLLYIYYTCPNVLGTAVPHDILNDSRQVFPQYMFNHLPSGVLGLMVIGLLAAALSSFNSAINSMTSSLVSDIFIPLKQKYAKKESSTNSQLKESRIIVVLMGVVLTSFAIVAAFMQEAGGQSLVDFALGIMSFSYSGMLGIFLCAVLTRRGNVKSVIAALIIGCLVVFLLQPRILEIWSKVLFGGTIDLAWPWWVVIGGSASFIVCCLGKK